MGIGNDVAKYAVQFFFTPKEQFESDKFYGWRNLLAGTVLFIGCAMTGYAAASFGLITLFGFTGFAHAGDVQELKMSQQTLAASVQRASNEVMAIVVGGQVFDLRVKQCAAAKVGAVDAYNAYSSEMVNKLELYRRVSGQLYPLQACP